MNWKRRLSTTAKYKIVYTKRVIVLGFHPVRVSANNTKCHYIGIIGAEANFETSRYAIDLFLFVRIDYSEAFISKTASRLPGLLQCLFDPVFFPSVAAV